MLQSELERLAVEVQCVGRSNATLHDQERNCNQLGAAKIFDKLEPFQHYAIHTILRSTVTVRGRDCGDEKRLALDYRGSLPRLAGCDRGLDRVAFKLATHRATSG